MSKSRHLSVLEFFEVLQHEYIVAEIRRKIYHSKKDKDYYEKVMDGKREKIDDIASRNDLPSIFTDDDVKNRYYNEVYGDSFPNFTYRNDKERNNLEQRDRDNYYRSGEDFKVIIDDGFKYAKLIDVDFENEVARLKARHQQEPMLVHIDHIQRIL